MRAAKLRSMKFAKAAPKGDDSKPVLPFAKKKKAESAGPVEGAPARARLDRPGRRMKRADGGETNDKRARAPGEKDEGYQRDYLKNKAQNTQDDADSSKWIGRVATGVGAAGAIGGRGLGRLPGAIAAGLGIPLLAKSNQKEAEAKRLSAEAKEFDKADAAEKKSGGRVRK